MSDEKSILFVVACVRIFNPAELNIIQRLLALSNANWMGAPVAQTGRIGCTQLFGGDEDECDKNDYDKIIFVRCAPDANWADSDKHTVINEQVSQESESTVEGVIENLLRYGYEIDPGLLREAEITSAYVRGGAEAVATYNLSKEQLTDLRYRAGEAVFQ
jgi:hypothetical protein